jgi:hypothetical protein
MLRCLTRNRRCREATEEELFLSERTLLVRVSEAFYNPSNTAIEAVAAPRLSAADGRTFVFGSARAVMIPIEVLPRSTE